VAPFSLRYGYVTIEVNMDKKRLAAKLQELGIAVTDGKVKKSDILAALAQATLSADRLKHLGELAEGTDFSDFASDAELKEVFEEHSDMFNKMPDDQIRVLLSGDYHTGSESHSFDNQFVEDVKSFVASVGPILGWDPEAYEDSSDKCGVCGKHVDYCECTEEDLKAGG
jgi:hypothetical protein